ncbi:MAG: glycosyltransferase [Rhodothermales bacterium]
MMVAGIVVLLAAVAIRLEWWWGLRRAGTVRHDLASPNERGLPEPDPAESRLPAGISVVVALRNEAANVDGLMRALLQQRVPPDVELEFVLVDDGSTDPTRAHLDAWLERDPRIRVPDTAGAGRPGVGAGKKAALTAGISAARFERLAFTDADARPGPDWLGVLAAQAAAAPRAVFVGQAPLTAEAPATLLGRYQRYDSLLTDLWAAAALGPPPPSTPFGVYVRWPPWPCWGRRRRRPPAAQRSVRSES